MPVLRGRAEVYVLPGNWSKNTRYGLRNGGTEVALYKGNRASSGANRKTAPSAPILYPGRTIKCPPAACTRKTRRTSQYTKGKKTTVVRRRRDDLPRDLLRSTE